MLSSDVRANLAAVLRNALSRGEDKYRRLRLDNEAVRTKLLPPDTPQFDSVMAVLLRAGFARVDNALVLAEGSDAAKIENELNALEDAEDDDAHADSAGDASGGADVDHWIVCDACGKTRQVDAAEAARAARTHWTCSMLTSRPRASCALADDELINLCGAYATVMDALGIKTRGDLARQEPDSFDSGDMDDEIRAWIKSARELELSEAIDDAFDGLPAEAVETLLSSVGFYDLAAADAATFARAMQMVLQGARGVSCSTLTRACATRARIADNATDEEISTWRARVHHVVQQCPWFAE